MAELEFTWSPAKATTNKRKHRVSFGEAQTVFYDDEGLLLDDPDHSETEDRFVLLGLSASLRVLSSFIPTRTKTTLSGSFPLARPLPPSVRRTTNGGIDEKRIRFVEGPKESLR